MEELLYNIDSRGMMLNWLQYEKGYLVCTDEKFNYYNVRVLGRFLMYRKNRFRPDGRKCYRLSESLAMVLGFDSLEVMGYKLTTLQYWRGFVSVQRLRVAFLKYDGRQEYFRKKAKEMGLY